MSKYQAVHELESATLHFARWWVVGIALTLGASCGGPAASTETSGASAESSGEAEASEASSGAGDESTGDGSGESTATSGAQSESSSGGGGLATSSDAATGSVETTGGDATSQASSLSDESEATSGGEASGEDSSGGSVQTCSPGSTLVPGETNRMVDVGGVMRSYILHVPDSYTGETPVPMVLDFHGLGGSGMQQRGSSGMAALSDSEGFVIAWPDGIDNAWNVGPCCTQSRDVDDLGFARAMVEQASEEGCVDRQRVYATGFSMGGGMSYHLACNAADIFAAIAPHGFDLAEETSPECAPSRPISVLSIRGTNDTVVPYGGGQGSGGRFTFLGAEGTLARWVELNACTGDPTVDGATALHTECAEGVEAGLHTLEGGGHASGPGSVTWGFLQRHALP